MRRLALQEFMELLALVRAARAAHPDRAWARRFIAVVRVATLLQAPEVSVSAPRVVAAQPV